MSAFRLSGRYAKSLIQLAQEKNELERVYQDMKLIREYIETSKDLHVVLKSPVINADKKEHILTILFEQQLSNITYTFVILLVRKGREKYLLDVTRSFINQYNTLKGITIVELTTAIEVNEQTVDRIKKAVFTNGNASSVQINKKIDPTIIGGFILKVNDKLLDASITRKLNLIEKELFDQSYINKV